jgi:Bax protein
MEKNSLSQTHIKFLLLSVLTLLIVVNSCNTGERKLLVGYVYIIKKPVHTPGDVVPIKKPNVIPYVYTSTCRLDTLPVQEKKQKFFDLLLPAVLVAKTNLDMTEKKVERLAGKNKLSPGEKHFLSKLMKRFKTNSLSVLLKRLHTFPVSIVLAQAAIESGWGSSRFFQKANNPFGIWSFDPRHQRIAADSSRNGTKVYLRKFDDLEQAIDAYYLMLATGKPFAAFREKRMKTSVPDSLIQTLRMYSERRDSYITYLAKLLRTSHLHRFDTYRIDTNYLRQPPTFRLFSY